MVLGNVGDVPVCFYCNNDLAAGRAGNGGGRGHRGGRHGGRNSGGRSLNAIAESVDVQETIRLGLAAMANKEKQ
jgi:hypothetical protein